MSRERRRERDERPAPFIERVHEHPERRVGHTDAPVRASSSLERCGERCSSLHGEGFEGGGQPSAQRVKELEEPLLGCRAKVGCVVASRQRRRYRIEMQRVGARAIGGPGHGQGAELEAATSYPLADMLTRLPHEPRCKVLTQVRRVQLRVV